MDQCKSPKLTLLKTDIERLKIAHESLRKTIIWAKKQIRTQEKEGKVETLFEKQQIEELRSYIEILEKELLRLEEFIAPGSLIKRIEELEAKIKDAKAHPGEDFPPHGVTSAQMIKTWYKEIAKIKAFISDQPKISEDIYSRLIADDTLQLKVDKLAQSEYGNLKNNKVKYKVFYSHKAAYEYILKQRDQLKKILTNNEIDALMTWAKSSKHLRLYAHALATNKKPLEVFKAAGEMPWSGSMVQIKQRYNALLSAISKVKTADNFTVYSGRMANQLQGIEGLKYGPQTAAEAKLLVGKVIEVPSFLNGSLLHNKAKGFAMAAERPVLIRLHVPKGSNMTFVDKGFKNSKGFGEAEFLMPPGTKFKIRRAHYRYTDTYGQGKGMNDILYIDAQVIAKDPLGVQNIDDIIKNSLAYFKNKHGTVTADVELDPKIRALNAREKVQKIESDVHSKEFTQVKKEIDDLTDEIVSTNEKRLLDEVNDVNTKFNEDMKKTNLIKKALKASLNCLIGKK